MVALHNGKPIDLAKGWGTATVCTEYADLTVRCFDTDAQAEADLAKFKAGHPETVKAPPAGRGDMKMNPQGKMETVPAASAVALSASVAAASPGCSWGFTCVYADLDYTGRKLQWDMDGTKTLGQYGFRDQTTSVANNDEIGGMTLIDYRDNMVDPTFIVCLGCAYGDLRQQDYPGWGTGSWDDRADALTM
ncbi:peptidase inhibitor family I36 protein [Streptomyces sp. NPDC056224]|uniref:peptidase inhibitor family I36 protein n=1 Tax=Streptomyces sp. NPDC056224 TaxID=3345750 RepID=UPI0035E3480D